MTDENHSPDDDEEQTVGGLLGAIRLVVDTLADAERNDRTTFGKSGRIPGGHFTTEFGFSGQIGGPRKGVDSESDSRSSNSRPATGSSSSSDERHLVDVRETDDELLVVADVPDVEPEDITAGIDEEQDELVVGVENKAVERMELPWPVADVEAQLQHGVLELRFMREEDEQ